MGARQLGAEAFHTQGASQGSRTEGGGGQHVRVLETNPHARLLGIRRLGIPKILKRLEEKKKPHVSMSSVSGIRLDYRCAHLPVSTRRGRGVDPSLRDLSGPARATPAMRSGRVGCGASWARPSPTPAFRVPPLPALAAARRLATRLSL